MATYNDVQAELLAKYFGVSVDEVVKEIQKAGTESNLSTIEAHLEGAFGKKMSGFADWLEKAKENPTMADYNALEAARLFAAQQAGEAVGTAISSLTPTALSMVRKSIFTTIGDYGSVSVIDKWGSKVIATDTYFRLPKMKPESLIGKVKIGDLVLDPGSVSEKFEDGVLKTGIVGKIRRPVSVFYDVNTGEYSLQDGYHRLLETMKRGDREILAQVTYGAKPGDRFYIGTDQKFVGPKDMPVLASEIARYKNRLTVAKMVGTRVKVMVDVQKEIKDFVTISKPTMLDGLTIGFNIGRATAGGVSITAADLLDIPSARKVLDRISLKMATKSLATTQEDLAAVLSTSIKEGDGAKELAAAISDKFDLDYMGTRSLLVARTEGTGVLNAGTQEQMTEDGINYKWWVATLGDERTRQSHLAVHDSSHQDPVPVAVPFQVGESSGMYPGDQMLAIKERANCRCRLAYPDEGEVRCRHSNRFFLREHGSYERKLQSTVNVYFRRMKARLVSKIDAIPFP